MKSYLDQRGFLPEGVHNKDWRWTESLVLDEWRKTLIERAKEFCQQEFQVFQDIETELYLAGSFFSDKTHPQDIEILLHLPNDISNYNHYKKLASINTLHDKIEDDLNLDVWITTPSNTRKDFRKFFQYIGEKSAQAKDLNAKDKRGIVRIMKWHHA